MNIKSIYRQIARQNGVSVGGVKREMQKAIDVAWDNPYKTAENHSAQKQVKPDGTKPTPEKLVGFHLQKVRKKR